MPKIDRRRLYAVRCEFTPESYRVVGMAKTARGTAYRYRQAGGLRSVKSKTKFKKDLLGSITQVLSG